VRRVSDKGVESVTLEHRRPQVRPVKQKRRTDIRRTRAVGRAGSRASGTSSARRSARAARSGISMARREYDQRDERDRRHPSHGFGIGRAGTTPAFDPAGRADRLARNPRRPDGRRSRGTAASSRRVARGRRARRSVQVSARPSFTSCGLVRPPITSDRDFRSTHATVPVRRRPATNTGPSGPGRALVGRLRRSPGASGEHLPRVPGNPFLPP
jgi:hypothetical protein